MIMWSVGLCIIVALVSIFVSHWVHKWRNPKCNGVLPPGFIGETLQLIIPSPSLDLHPFIKKRIQRYGLVFRTSVAGRPVVVSADPKINHFIIMEEGKSVELWYLDTFSKIFAHDTEAKVNAVGAIQKYIRSIALNHFDVESIKEKLLPHIEEMVHKTLHTWSSQQSIEVKHASSKMIFKFTLKQIFGYDSEESSEKLSDKFANFLKGLMSFPLNIPGTTFHRCLKDHKEVLSMMKDIVKERLSSPEPCRGDFLDQSIQDMKTEKFLTEDFIVQIMFGILFANLETISLVLILTFKFLSEHPSVLEELTAEQEAILENRESSDSPLTWDEYKSMTFTLQVINEVLRLGNVAPGLLRRATKDIKVNGYTIPAGWNIMVVTSALQLDPNNFKDPIEFNPWRWKDLDSNVVSKNFIMPFGGGVRQCAGADYSKAFMATFLHVLVTRYRWTKIKGGNVVRKPILEFV